MNVDEILSAISKFRQEKLNNLNARSKSPISSLATTKTPSRSISPINPYSSTTSPKPFRPRLSNLNTPVIPKQPQIMDYKIDAAGLILETLQKFKKRIFHLLEKNISLSNFNLEISFKHTGKNFISPKLKNEYINKAQFFDEKDFYLSPSFSNQTKMLFGGLSSFSEGLGMISSVFIKKFEKVKKGVWVDLNEFAKRVKNGKTVEKFVKVLSTFYCKLIFFRLRARDVYHKRTWELPLKIDLKNISQKSETIDFSSADQSEVLFEPVLDSSSQFTNRFQNSGERIIRELTLSSIISYEERQNTDRVFNLTKLKHPIGVNRRKKVSYDICDSLSDSRSFRNIRVPSKARVFQKPLGIMLFFIENYLKSFGFKELVNVFTTWKKKKGLEKMIKIADSQLKNVIISLKRLNNFPSLVKKLAFIRSSKILVVVVKFFVKWKIFSRLLKNRALRNFGFLKILALKFRKIVNQRKFDVLRVFKGLKLRKKFEFSLFLCLFNTLKRVSKESLDRKKIFAFNILSIVNKEYSIKAYNLGKIVSNVRKDIRFRVRVCFGHWKKSIEIEKSQYLQGLSFIQSINQLFDAKKRFAFSILAHYERSFLNLSYT